MTFPNENMIYRERHCPPEEEKLHRLIPAPKGYMTPFPWPKCCDYVHYANVEQELMAAVIIDPTKVVRCCLEHTSSLAKTS
ncbi:hypothetical protein LWI29_013539 [Acer saccharum]|uniref:Methyltransferase n=1 Tax=Acer saccharum TaxID=4024 RepID=A0AA39RCJ2_ACESA|nr:hypothetical protein LWI29_013539 [Acer saccharum]